MSNEVAGILAREQVADDGEELGSDQPGRLAEWRDGGPKWAQPLGEAGCPHAGSRSAP